MGIISEDCERRNFTLPDGIDGATVKCDFPCGGKCEVSFRLWFGNGRTPICLSKGYPRLDLRRQKPAVEGTNRRICVTPKE